MNSVPGNFWEWTSSLGFGERFTMLVLGAFALVFVVTMIACTIHAMHKNRLNDQLKRELVDRGMSADEIATIITAKADKSLAQRSTRQ